MERFALAAAVVLGFALTAALCSLFVPCLLYTSDAADE